jgi:predicted nucleotide-binding protein (sugar kinase/HSP70/actin superfamily)
MRIGIPEGLLFHRYERFIRCFFDRLGVDVIYSGKTNRKILEEGIKSCVDEACLPIKVFHGHVSKLRKECDKIAVLRLMKCEYGESICPKFCGLPELVKSGTGEDNLVFTGPLYLNDKNKAKKAFIRDAKLLGIPAYKTSRAFEFAFKELYVNKQREELDNRIVIALLGHPYNTKDSFINMNLKDKLKNMDIGIVTEEDVPEDYKLKQQIGLLKKPYWLFLRDNYGAASYLSEEKRIDGIIYLSSFSCGTDSITIELIRNKVKDLPILVLKLDEHTGEAGFNTRIEAFIELLERRKMREDYLS